MKKKLTLSDVASRLEEYSAVWDHPLAIDDLLRDIRETLAAQQAKHDVWKSAKRTIAVDFDGVIHQYKTPWKGPAVIPDPPIPGAFAWLAHMSTKYQIMIFSARCNSDEGIHAMMDWFTKWGLSPEVRRDFIYEPGKPSAFVFIDDRAIGFRGSFDNAELYGIGGFKPWYYANPEWRKNRE